MGDSMENFRIIYSKFHKELIRFVEDLSQRFVPNAPPAIKHVALLPTILTPDDAEIVTGDVSGVKGKFRLVLYSFTNLTLYIIPHVQELHRDWAWNQLFKLDWLLNIAKIILDRITPLEDYNVTKATAGGIGGSNSGIQTGVSVSNIRKLMEMDSAIKARM